MAYSRAACAALLLLAVASAAAAASRDRMTGRRLSQATATAVADAHGGMATSTSDAGAVSTGPPASSTVISTSTSGPGQTVVAQCSGYAYNSDSYKVCVGQATSPPYTTSSSPGGSSFNSTAWATTPTCTGNLATAYSVPDSTGRLWGFENGASCVYKDASGDAVYAKRR